MSQPSPTAPAPSRVEWLIPAALFLGSLLLIWGLVLTTRGHYTTANLEADEIEYYELATEVLQGRYDFNPRRVVGFFLVIAGIRRVLGDNLLVVQLSISLLTCLTAPLTYLIARRELGQTRAAVVAGLGVMLWPIYIRYGATLFSETLALPVFAATLLAMPRPKPTDNGVRAGRWLLAGAMLGLCMHLRPMYLIFAPFAALLAFWRGRVGWVPSLARVAFLTGGCLMVVLPWSILLTRHEGQFILLSSNGGEVFAGSNTPELLRREQAGDTAVESRGGRVVSVFPGKWVPMEQTGYLSPEELRLPFTQQAQMQGERARAWMMANPGMTVYYTMRKVVYMWGIYPFWSTRSQTLLGNVPLIGLLVLSLTSLVRFRRFPRETALFWIPILFVTTVAVLTWGSWRFREPGDLGLFGLAAALPWANQVSAFFVDHPASIPAEAVEPA